MNKEIDWRARLIIVSTQVGAFEACLPNRKGKNLSFFK